MMTVVQDTRFDETLARSLIGQKFLKYRCDEFKFTNSVTGTVGLFIGDAVYELHNEQETFDYFGVIDDNAVFKIRSCKAEEIVSFFDDIEQIDNSVNEIIEAVDIVNENQQIYKDGEKTYDVWLTRAIIFHVGGREIAFEKDVVPFSEEIVIRKGYDLVNELDGEDVFLEGWDESITPKCSRETISLKKP